MDMLRMQQTIMQNSIGIQDYMADLNSWVSDVGKKDKSVLSQAKPMSQVRIVALYLLRTFQNIFLHFKNIGSFASSQKQS